MKAIKRAFFGGIVLSVCGIFALGSFNSFNLDRNIVFKNDLNIKFAKRLDDITGEYVVGRMAASIPTGTIFNKKVVEVKKGIEKEVRETITENQVNDIPEPAVFETEELFLTGGLYNKEPLKEGDDFRATTKVENGIISAINVTFPDGKTFNLNTNEPMVGNVFQYQDSETGDTKSGLFYEIKEGHYMLTLTDDTNFTGLRLEFKAEEGTKLATNEKKMDANWDMDQHDQNNEVGVNEEKANDEEFAKETEVEEVNSEKQEEFEDGPYAKAENTFSFKFAMK